MSAEFEKIVLEKLNILDELKVEVKNLTSKVDNLEVKVDSLEEKVNSNTNAITSLSEKVDINIDSINNLSKNININTELIASLSKQVEQQRLNFAKFEHECILKLNALFDSFVANTESHASFSKAIAALNLENFHQGIRISNLENLNNNTKILATN